MEEVYAAVFMNAIHYHVRSEDHVEKRAVYIAVGISMSEMFWACKWEKTKVPSSGSP